MNATATIRMDRAYFEAAYRHWLEGRSRWRKWQPWIGVVLLVAAVAVALFTRFRATAVVLLAFSIVQGAESLFHRRHWVRDRLRARGGEDRVVTLAFDDEGMRQEGTEFFVRVSWSGLPRPIEVPDGFVLLVGDGASIYVPRDSVSPPEAFAEILRRAGVAPQDPLGNEALSASARS